MPDLIVETDLGHDPDDLFALCYLAAPDPTGDHILADIDRGALWDCFRTWM